jgi:hypothetical protein
MAMAMMPAALAKYRMRFMVSPSRDVAGALEEPSLPFGGTSKVLIQWLLQIPIGWSDGKVAWSVG